MKTATIVIIVIVAVLVLAGAAVGIYFGVTGSSDNSKPVTSTGTKPSSSKLNPTPVEPSTAKVEKIAYLNNKDIYVVNLDGTGRQMLTNRADIVDFAVSPTGAMMAFVAEKGSGQNTQHVIFKMNADGTGVSQVTLPEKGIVDNPAFDPTGKYIYFTRVTPQDQANIQAGKPFSTGFERYNIAANSVDHIYSYGGMQEESISGIFPDPDGGNLYFNRYGSDFPSSIPYELTLGASPTATVYMPMVTNSPGFTVIAYQLTGFSMDGAYLTYFKQALATDASGPQISACYKLLSTGEETSVASYTQSQSSQGNVAGMQFSSVDTNKYYYSKVAAVGPGSAWTFDFYKGTTNGTQSAAGLSVTVANAENTDFIWHPLAVQK
jgi:hypothetical protein